MLFDCALLMFVIMMPEEWIAYKNAVVVLVGVQVASSVLLCTMEPLPPPRKNQRVAPRKKMIKKKKMKKIITQLNSPSCWQAVIKLRNTNVALRRDIDDLMARQQLMSAEIMRLGR